MTEWASHEGREWLRADAARGGVGSRRHETHRGGHGGEAAESKAAKERSVRIRPRNLLRRLEEKSGKWNPDPAGPTLSASLKTVGTARAKAGAANLPGSLRSADRYARSTSQKEEAKKGYRARCIQARRY